MPKRFTEARWAEAHTHESHAPQTVRDSDKAHSPTVTFLEEAGVGPVVPWIDQEVMRGAVFHDNPVVP